MAKESAANIVSSKDYPNTKKGWYDRWMDEIRAAEKAREKFIKSGKKVVLRFNNQEQKSTDTTWSALNLFHSNIVTLQSMLYGKTPYVDLDRSHQDANDDAARVGAEMLERMLNAEIEEPGSKISEALKNALEDRLLPGCGTVRVRYEYTSEKRMTDAITKMDESGNEVELAPAYEEEVTLDESAPLEYVFWRDYLWSPCRTWDKCRWNAYKVRVTKDTAIKRWGKKIADKLPLTDKPDKDQDGDFSDSSDDEFVKDAWQRIVLWEIWSEELRKVFWICPGYHYLLEQEEDPLGLNGFYPSPRPMTANVTTSAFMPTADFKLAEDLYNSIDELTTRVNLITEALRVVGVYDSANKEVERMLDEGMENQLYPVDSWAVLSEKGGIKGVIDWMPIKDIADVLEKLTQKRETDIQLLYQVTGMSEILRGASSGNVSTATENQLKSKFGSVRIQALQDEFANFASDAMRIKAEIISLHFDKETIVAQSNIKLTMDADVLDRAVELIKDPSQLAWRVKVRPESVAMVDYALLKEERTEFINALAVFMQSAMPLVEIEPKTAPALLEILKWTAAGFKGSSDIEGVLDRAISTLVEAQQQQQDDDKDEAVKAEEAKNAAKLAQIEAEKQAKLEVIAAELKADTDKHRNEATLDVQEAQGKHEMEMAELEEEHVNTVIQLNTEHENEMEELRVEHTSQIEEIKESAKNVATSSK